MNNVPKIFGSKVFNHKMMQERLPRDTYKALRDTIASGKHLDRDTANVIAHAMKEWAIANGAAHFTHWFQPMTGVTAEKHDSFITPCDTSGIIMQFSGKELIKGEADASSFPSGGLRATFEARGYTAWDPTSYAFIKDDTLCIPTAFCSFDGEALDMKTPLLRSMQALDMQALRVLRLLGNENASRVFADVGAEQEYFLVDMDVYQKRPDLIYTGRTLFGARPPKGQEMGDHYYGIIKHRVSEFMKDLDTELWKVGVLAKTKHNEAAPAQHELASIFSAANIASDHNQLTMELMKSVAGRHNLACLLHEKPFKGINGSGKHNNWSISTNEGEKLLKAGDIPEKNPQFLLFLMAVIKAVDEYQDLLRVSVASASNDHRLGAHEAPPGIVSVFLGDDLTQMLDSIESGARYKGKKKSQMEVGVNALPNFLKDTTDRNRTSPFAFTGNRFEFRMVGSSATISMSNIILNTIVAESLCQFADKLEGTKNFHRDLNALIRETISKHKRILFNGNNYSEEWEEEAEKRGLLNLKTTKDALPYLIDKKNIDLFERHEVFTAKEIHSRYEMLLENYIKTIKIESFTLIDMVRKQIIPAVIEYQGKLAELIELKEDISKLVKRDVELSLLKSISQLLSLAYDNLTILEDNTAKLKIGSTLENANFCYEHILLEMQKLRDIIDKLETMVDEKCWPFPSYGDILYSVY